MDLEIIKLFRKHYNNECSASELERVLELFAQGQSQKEWDYVLAKEANKVMLGDFQADMSVNEISNLHDKIIDSINKQSLQTIKPFSRKSFWNRISIAASILLVASAGLYLYSNKSANKTQDRVTYANDINPGKNTAMLTLSNGKEIRLSAAKTGVVIDATKLRYNDGTSISVQSSAAQSPNDNGAKGVTTLSTPRGGQYQVILSDGTKVWLNAASSLKFPSIFTNERSVELLGEAYFEVAQDKKHPFIVKTTRQNVTVLGTHFNINSYANETTAKTTLLEGSVRISSPASSSRNEVIMKPGQQAISSNGAIKVTTADTELAIAWKNNKFMFDHDKIENIMRMVERWYNVEVVYEGEIPTDQFGGSVSRFDKVSKVLSILELTGNVHFKIEGRRITVTK